MSRVRRDEGGQVIVLSAVMIPVFLLMAALILDVGNWYTHKRQLQNRADAGAFAAGTAYAKNWKACVQTGDPTLKANTAQEIADAAREYAGDPEASDYAGGALPASLFNTEIANQNKLNVNINSTTYDNTDGGGSATDYSDDYDGNAATRLGNPCFLHPADDLSAAGYWTDVKVKEGLLPSLAGLLPSFFGKVDPLSRNGARARIEIRPAISGHRFLPLAIPDNVITQVQIRYFDQCTGNELAKQDLAQLPDGTYGDYQNGGGGSLWAPKIPGSDPPAGDPMRPVGVPLTAYDPAQCGGLQYRPISEQVRVASAPDINLDTLSCSQLQASSFADCFTRLSQIRIWKDGNPDVEPLVKDVNVLGGCGTPGDGYFGVLPLAATDCRYDVSVNVDWGDRDDGTKRTPVTNFTVKANGVTLPYSSRSGETATYVSSGGALTGNPGANPITISVAWYDDGGPTHVWQGKPCVDPPGSAKSPCIWVTSTAVAHQTFVGTNSSATTSDPSATGAVESVHNSLSKIDSTGKLGPSFDNWVPSSGGGNPCVSPCSVYPTVGIRSALTSGTVTTLRTGGSQGSQLVDCDPNVTQILTLFQNGCEPWYGPNSFTDINWWTAAKECPKKTDWFSYSAPLPYTNSPGNPWRCVLNQGGSIVGQAGDWMAVATDNCNKVNPGGTQCQDFKKKTDPTVHCADYEAWAANGDSEDPRVVSLFVVPYQSLKNVSGSGSQAGIPVLRFASFYVMNWHGNNAGESDPCPDLDFKGVPVDLPSGPGRQGHDPRCLRYHGQLRNRPGRPSSRLPRKRPNAMQACTHPMICRYCRK